MCRKVLPLDLGLRFHKVLIETVLTYGAPAWYCQPKSTEMRLFNLQVTGLRAALDLPFDCDPFGVLVEAKVEAITDVFAKHLENYGERCKEANNGMIEYISYVANLIFDSFGRKVMDKQCPAWHLKSGLVESQHGTGIRKFFLTDN